MKYTRFLLFLIVLLFNVDGKAYIKYIHPLPNSQFHSPYTTIIVRFEDSSGLDNPYDVSFFVNGSASGSVTGENILSTDGETYIFKPLASFKQNEKVDVTIIVPKLGFEYLYSFTTSATTSLQATQPGDDPEVLPQMETTDSVRVVNGVSLPSDFPDIQITQNGATAPGFIFLTTYDLRINYSMILHNDGTPYFYKRRLGNSKLWDFTVQADTILTLMEGATAKTFDQHFEPVDSYKCGHGYKNTDYHEFRVTPQGHVLLIAQDVQKIDMSALVSGGKTNASVVGNLFQELDREKNVIFEWRSWDNYNILDANLDSFTKSVLHYVHINAIDIDYDGHYLISARTLDEITKINRDTGEIIWRLGGRNNQFDFINDPDRFYYQHDIRAVPDKPDHYTIFDNGTYHVPPYSRAVEYQLDLATKSATKVWEYRHTPDYYSHWMGSVQRLPNGNTAICWALKNLPNFTEVDAQGNIVYDLQFTPTATSYRAHRHQWQGKAKRPYLLVEPTTEHITLIFNHFGATNITKYFIYADTTQNPATRIDSTTNPYIHLVNLENFKTYYFRVTSVDDTGKESEFSNQEEADVRLQRPGDNMLINGDFSDGLLSWRFRAVSNLVADWHINEDEQFHVHINTPVGANDVQLSQQRLVIQNKKTYKLEFDARADVNRQLDVRVLDMIDGLDYSELGLVKISPRKQRYSFEFTMRDPSDDTATLVFNMGDVAGDVYLDNIYLGEVVESTVEKKPQSPALYHLYPNTPNPFNASTTICYTLAHDSRVELTFYDLLGRIVHRVNFPRREAGEHRYLFDAAQLSSGIYFCQLCAGNTSNHFLFTDSIKLTLIK
ncbi:aryl-sulfate sulfotransferase [candidate division KSB1 bacterium]|nr:aryl-sulfate sulfotransferase [candidate division KSB1 bacterium]